MYKCSKNVYIVLVKILIITVTSPIKVLDKGLLPLEKNSVALQFFLDFENVDKMHPCKIFVRPSQCCLFITKENTDCDSMKLYGESADRLKPNDRKTYLYIYPTLAQLNHQGYCDFSVKYRCRRRTSDKTQEVKIHFDTRYNKKAKKYFFSNIKGQKIARCKKPDDDPLNNCKPVNCDYKYAGAKPFYDRNMSLCLEAPECLSSPNKSLPDIAYDPRSNTCRDLEHSLTIADIYLLSSGLAMSASLQDLNQEDTRVIFKPNCTSISQNMFFLRDMMYGKLEGSIKRYNVDFSESCRNALVSIFSVIFGVSLGLITFVCCAIFISWYRGHEGEGELVHLKDKVRDLKSRIKATELNCESNVSQVNRDVRNKLLREVIVSDLPLELRESMVDICERINKEVRWKKRYRMLDVGSQISLRKAEETDTSTTSDLDYSEKERLLN